MMCENFALSIFEKADEEDRAGLSNKETARCFYNGNSHRHLLLGLILLSFLFFRYFGSVWRTR
jgi:hypothetical protein